VQRVALGLHRHVSRIVHGGSCLASSVCSSAGRDQRAVLETPPKCSCECDDAESSESTEHGANNYTGLAICSAYGHAELGDPLFGCHGVDSGAIATGFIDGLVKLEASTREGIIGTLGIVVAHAVETIIKARVGAIALIKERIRAQGELWDATVNGAVVVVIAAGVAVALDNASASKARVELAESERVVEVVGALRIEIDRHAGARGVADHGEAQYIIGADGAILELARLAASRVGATVVVALLVTAGLRVDLAVAAEATLLFGTDIDVDLGHVNLVAR